MYLNSLHSQFLPTALFVLLYSLQLHLFPVQSHAQSLSLQAPRLEVSDAEDYFTDVWNSPRDFSDVCDIGDEDFVFDPELVENGVWTGRHPGVSGPTAKILPIHQIGAPIVFQEDCHKLAIHRPVDADKYSLLSYRARLTQPSEISIRWSKNKNFAINGAFPQRDTRLLGDTEVVNPRDTWMLNQFDLPQIADPAFPWSGFVTGLDIQASVFQATGGEISFDWIRLINPSSSTIVPLSWNLSGRSLAANESIVIFLDTDESGFDGMPVHSSQSTSGSFQFLSGTLPSGRYSFYAEVQSSDGVNIFSLLRSDYSGALSINSKPTASFLSPTRTSGRAYSRDERRDAWDMSQPSDVLNFKTALGANQALGRGFSNPQIQNGVFIAESDADPLGASISVDPQLLLPTSRPVDTNAYRYFCHRSQIDTSAINRSVDPVALNDAGFFARLIFADSGRNLFGSTGGHEVIERSSSFLDGLVTYCIDLWDSEVMESGVAWQDLGFADVIRFDPLESKDSRKFAVDFAELYQENETEDSEYLISWETNDIEGDVLTTTLYYDSNESGFDGVRIATFNNQQPGAQSFLWNTNSVPAGRYYVYVEVRDAQNTNRLYADVPIIVSNRPTVQDKDRTPCDYDADGQTDLTVVRPNFSGNFAHWLTRNPRTNETSSTFWGNPNIDIFLDRDSNADGRSEYTVVRKELPLNWIELSTLTQQASTTPWGLKGDIPVAVDFDGDEKEENAVFRPVEGNWYSILSNGGVLVEQWGLPGDIPVAADYDGDGFADLAIWRPATGIWAITLSTRSFSRAPADIVFVQWGLPGDQPMLGDYTGDGRADLSVWRPSLGMWFVCSSDTNFSCSNAHVRQFGLPGDYPVSADFDGDSQLDFSVFRPSNGTWYSLRSSDSTISVQQWGLPGDLPMCISPLFTASFS